MLDPMSFSRFSEDGPHDERAQRGRETDMARDDHHHETETDRYDQRGLVGEKFTEPSEQDREKIDPEQKPKDEKKTQLQRGKRELPARQALRDRDRGQEDKQQDRDQVFDDQDPKYKGNEASPLHAELVEGADDDGSGGDREDTPQKEAIHFRPAQELACDIAHPEHG